MLWLGLPLLALVGCFGFVLLYGAPYLPTLGKQVDIALDMVGLESGQTLLELGCGDGKVLLAAARRGYHAVGYELNPLLALICRLRTWRYRRQVSVKWGNFLTRDWPPAEAIFVFGLQRVMPRLDKKIRRELKSWPPESSGEVKLVSFAFTVPGKRPLDSREGLYLYRYDTPGPAA